MGQRAIHQTAPSEIKMFHKAIELTFLEDTMLELAFQDGKVMHYDISDLFGKYPQMEMLTDRSLFTSGLLSPGGYGIIWNDDLDLDAETVYKCGKLFKVQQKACIAAGSAVLEARANAELSQKELSALTGIDQSDISKIERGISNPTVDKLERIADALGRKLIIRIE